jgi:hypothetical protein
MKHTGFVLGLMLVGTAACSDNGHVVADRDVGSAGDSESGGRSGGGAGPNQGGNVSTGGASNEHNESGGSGDAGARPTGGRGDGGVTDTGGQGDGGSTGGSASGGRGDGGSTTGGHDDGGALATGGQGDGGSTGGSATGGTADGGSTGGSEAGGTGDGGSATGGQDDGGAPATGGLGSGGGMVVPGCKYRDIPGTGRLTSIEPATEADGELCENGSVSARYAFTPDDASLSPDEYDVATVNMDPVRYQQLKTNSRLIPPACVELLGLEVNAQFTVLRRIAVSGSCTPAVDTFPDLDLASCASLCAS